jgi:hypothetical protein
VIIFKPEIRAMQSPPHARAGLLIAVRKVRVLLRINDSVARPLGGFATYVLVGHYQQLVHLHLKLQIVQAPLDAAVLQMRGHTKEGGQ